MTSCSLESGLGTLQDHGTPVGIAGGLGSTALTATSRQYFKEGKETVSEPQSKLSVV